MVIPVDLSAQGPDRRYVLDSLIATTECPDVLPAIRDWAGNLTEEDLCVLVAAALHELAGKHPWLSDPASADRLAESQATVLEDIAQSGEHRVLEAAWRVVVDVPGEPRLLRVTIDQRTGRTRSGTEPRNPNGR